jgi:dGTPase
MDITDEIAYSTADLDDGVEAMILTREQVREGLPVFARLHAEVERLYPEAVPKLQFNETLKRVLDRLVSDLIAHSRALIASSGVQSAEAVRHHARSLIGFSPQVEDEQRQIRAFLYRNVYFSEELQPEKEMAEQVISELFEFFMKSPEELPTSYQEKTQQEPRYRIVCDYIAGMTDNFVLEQHRHFCTAPRRARV